MSIRPARFSRARLSRPALTRAAVGAGLAAALFVGAAAPAAAQPTGSDAAGLPDIPPGVIQAIPGMPDLSPIMPSLPESTGEKVELGRANLSLPVVGYDATLNKQVVAGQRVLPGGLVTVRLEVAGNGGRTFVRELRNVMPAGFELVSVMRMKSNALGEAAHILSEEEYDVVERGDDGLREVKVSWNEDGLLGFYQDNPRIQNGESIVVDFVYRAPMEPGDYKHGGVMRVSSLANLAAKNAGGDTGGVPINVALAPENVFGSLEGYGVGSM
ncbi:hypothetical protein FOB82_06070 [Corynebacterium xerosis]|uniref:Uncharacterized protein n=1 Tax=Corynebacterium xerosis TaxID=1725 RepID=A0A6B8TTS1_9CORY|nr:hypothetical protein [Corynebacterium xerosis]QGS34583.1 hypothetical protein FOB82_06070 [Corynebacterium xerosis]